MKRRETSSQPWYRSRVGALVLAALAVLLAYPLALRALDTGSLQQYTLLAGLFIFICGMLSRAVRVKLSVSWRRAKRAEKKEHDQK